MVGKNVNQRELRICAAEIMPLCRYRQSGAEHQHNMWGSGFSVRCRRGAENKKIVFLSNCIA